MNTCLAITNIKKKINKTVLQLIICMTLINNAWSQLDTIHYIPPMYARQDSATDKDEDIYLVINTNSDTNIVVKITDGRGVPLSFSPIIVNRSTPITIALSEAIGATKGIGTKFLVPKDSLSKIVSNEGLILSGKEKFYASIRVKEDWQAACLSSKGKNAFGREFRSGHLYNDGSHENYKSHLLSFMATEDSTVVTVCDFGNVDFQNQDEGNGTITVGPMNKGQSYVLAAFADKSDFNDLNGTKISANKDIVVNSGSWLGGSPGGSYTGRDIGIDQITPVSSVGTEYIAVRGQGKTAENIIVVATENNTNIYINQSINSRSAVPVNPAPLNAGEYFVLRASSFSTNENIYIWSNYPVYSYQGMNATEDIEEKQTGMNFLPPLGCSGGTVVDMPNIDQLGEAVIHVIAQSGETVTIDNGNGAKKINVPGKTVIGKPEYVTYKLFGYKGNITIACTRPIGAALTTVSGASGSAAYFSAFNTIPVIKTVREYSNAPCILDSVPVELKSQNYDSYQWYKDGEILSHETDSILSVLSSGVYTVKGYYKGCGYSNQSKSIEIVDCKTELGIAKSVVNTINVRENVYDIVYDIIIKNFSESKTAFNTQVTDDITEGLTPGAIAILQKKPIIRNGSFSKGGLSNNYDGITDIAMLQTSATTVDTDLPASSSVTIRYTVRVDMNKAYGPLYSNQAIATITPFGPNNGVKGTFISTDLSDDGTNADPDNDGNPSEEGENDPTTLCLSFNSFTYNSSTFYIDENDPKPIITVKGGDFSSTPGLTVNQKTGQIDISESTEGAYTITYDFDGICPSSKRIKIESISHLYVPNSFTPNGDNINDYFFANGIDIENYRMDIFNRWGKVIFSSKDKNIKWDGTENGKPAQTGSYTYRVSAYSFSKKSYKKVGLVNLIR